MQCCSGHSHIHTRNAWSFSMKEVAELLGPTFWTGAPEPPCSAGLAGSVGDAAVISGRPTPLRVDARVVTANFFHVLGVSAARGRVFGEDDARPDAAPTVGYSLFAIRRSLKRKVVARGHPA